MFLSLYQLSSDNPQKDNFHKSILGIDKIVSFCIFNSTMLIGFFFLRKGEGGGRPCKILNGIVLLFLRLFSWLSPKELGCEVPNTRIIRDNIKIWNFPLKWQGPFKKSPVSGCSFIYCLIENGWDQAINLFRFRRLKQRENKASPRLCLFYKGRPKSVTG